MQLRKAVNADVPAMLEIYLPYVNETAITFEIDPPTLNDFQQRFSDTVTDFPWLVCEQNGKIAGYAYATSFRTRKAYRWSVESTVYVDQDLRGKGIGIALYQELILRLRAMGVVNVIGGISLPNDASVSLHEKLGFIQVAQLKNIGFKLGKWWDVGYWQLELQTPSLNPSELRPFFE